MGPELGRRRQKWGVNPRGRKCRYSFISFDDNVEDLARDIDDALHGFTLQMGCDPWVRPGGADRIVLSDADGHELVSPVFAVNLKDEFDFGAGQFGGIELRPGHACDDGAASDPPRRPQSSSAR